MYFSRKKAEKVADAGYKVLAMEANTTASTVSSPVQSKPLDNKPGHSMCCHLAIGAATLKFFLSDDVRMSTATETCTALS